MFKVRTQPVDFVRKNDARPFSITNDRRFNAFVSGVHHLGVAGVRGPVRRDGRSDTDERHSGSTSGLRQKRHERRRRENIAACRFRVSEINENDKTVPNFTVA